jgi:GAF domain-containing protein
VRSSDSLPATKRETGVLPDHHTQLLRTFADQAVIAIENARLFNETREALERQTATSDVLKIISRSSVELEMVLDTLVQTVARLCRADQVYMFHLRHDLWHLIADYGLSAEARAFFENARLFNDTREALEQQTATADVLKVISRSAFDLQTVLDTLTEAATQLANADMGSIARKDDRGYYHATNYKFAVDWVKAVDPYRLHAGRDSLVGRALLAKKAVQIPDVLADAEYKYSDMQKAAGYRTLLGIPVLRSPGANREAGLAWPAHRWDCARDQEPAQFG